MFIWYYYNIYYLRIIKLSHLKDFHFDFFYSAVNKLMTAKTQNIFNLLAEHSYFTEYSLFRQIIDAYLWNTSKKWL